MPILDVVVHKLSDSKNMFQTMVIKDQISRILAKLSLVDNKKKKKKKKKKKTNQTFHSKPQQTMEETAVSSLISRYMSTKISM